MIRMSDGALTVECDDCGRESDDLLLSFDEAHAWKWENDWGSEHGAGNHELVFVILGSYISMVESWVFRQSVLSGDVSEHIGLTHQRYRFDPCCGHFGLSGNYD